MENKFYLTEEGEKMPFLKTVIPSFDRACQLDLLLRSIEQNWDINQLDIYVLYKYTSEKFKAAYDILIEKLKKYTNILFILEENFEEQIKQIIMASIGYICFFTDDCIFYRRSNITPCKACKILTNHPEILSFNYRLGDNTIIQNYLTGETQIPLRQLGYKYLQDYPETIEWRWRLHPANNNYSYIFSWDGNLYRASFLYDMLKGVHFTNPRTLEGNISGNQKKRESIKEECMSSPLNSCVSVLTINSVQDFGPPAGQFYSYSIQDLNEQFLANRRISLEGFNFENMLSSHFESEIIFEEY